MATPNLASESPSGEGTKNLPRSDCSPEHHFSSTKPHLLFLPETHLSEATDSNLFSVPSYFLYPHIRSKAGCCIYVRNDLTCSRAHALESSVFSTFWLLALSTPTLMIPPYIFPRPFRDNQPFRKSSDHAGTPHNA
ncbi:hypothetical protein E2C01_043064 [Portunus trituberculatus]|uniref:Uncharacterized protein n=1 Tax=Portunus trituberculatus TaxID=210409 RepID=A0A5B7FUN4_PORTR|nr:hypothetical protein [Portunus trituberculatus]